MFTLEEILEARTVAVIGASRDKSKPGAMLLRVLKEVGFRGEVVGVNPQGGEVNGVKLYRNLEEVPFQVDLAVVLIPPRQIPEAVAACGRKGVKGVVISAEGFAEAGPEGRKLQEDVLRVLRENGMRGFGPNTLGLVNTATGLTTSYFATKAMLKPGAIGVAAQSGIFVGALLRYMSSMEGLELSKGLGLGNKMDVNECDALEYLARDDQTKIVVMYLEDLREGRRFLDTAKGTTKEKPVLLLKGARTAEGARASSSHTGSLAVEDNVLQGAIRQAGILRMGSIEELIWTLKGFRTMPLPRGNRIAIVTYSGAQAILTIDEAINSGLQMATFLPPTLAKLSEVIATPSKASNPVDLFPDMMTHGFERTSIKIMEALLEDPGVNAIIFISFAATGPEPYGPVATMVKESASKPVFFSLLGTRDDMEACKSFLEGMGIPCVPFPETAAKVISHMWRYTTFKEQGEP